MLPFWKARYYVASLLGRVRATSRLTTRHGFALHGNARDMVSRYIYTFGTWEPNLTALVKARVGLDTQFYDCGTNIGYFSVLAANLGARVTGFEASPEMAQLAQANLRAAGFAGVVHNVALAAEEGELALHDVSGATNTGSRSVVKTSGAVHAVVRAAPLLSLVQLDPAAELFFKIDIEGAEGPVLAELLSWMAAHPLARVTIVAEVLDGAADTVRAFADLGCEVAYLPNSYAFAAYLHGEQEARLVPMAEGEPEKPFETVIWRD
ncbi:FkbM family methyltransferase [Erythrobacter sp. EC-HK427]|uniref:FkbM family methyltransferase n=1 Tax=Erythrobacter sp. EC-HK427 TaxID=2038396 RepID=UPI001F015A28|nr:FkbM family methyltransferase [Erythrobacter sp. EC-HK427]